MPRHRYSDTIWASYRTIARPGVARAVQSAAVPDEEQGKPWFGSVLLERADGRIICLPD